MNSNEPVTNLFEAPIQCTVHTVIPGEADVEVDGRGSRVSLSDYTILQLETAEGRHITMMAEASLVGEGCKAGQVVTLRLMRGSVQPNQPQDNSGQEEGFIPAPPDCGDAFILTPNAIPAGISVTRESDGLFEVTLYGANKVIVDFLAVETFEDLEDAVSRMAEEWRQLSQGKLREPRTWPEMEPILQALDEYIIDVSPEQLAKLRQLQDGVNWDLSGSRADILTVEKGATVSLLGTRYFNPALSALRGQKVEVRYDPNDLTRVAIFANGQQYPGVQVADDSPSPIEG